MVVNIHKTTSLILAQPNFHYPIPTSFELTQRGPTDWVCGATNNALNTSTERYGLISADD